MHHQDAKHVREVMAVHDAAELAAARSAAADGSPQAAAGDMNLEPAQTAAFGGSSSDGDDGGEEAEDEEAAGCNTGAGSAGASVDGSKLARPDSDGMPVVLPWWLPPEQVPAEVSGEAAACAHHIGATPAPCTTQLRCWKTLPCAQRHRRRRT